VSRPFVLYGRNPIREALRAARRPVRRVWATRGAAAEPWLRDVKVVQARPEEIAERAGTEAHQGLCAEVGEYPYASADGLLARADPLIVVLDELQDPQNLGAICRTAECVGADGVVIPERRSADVTPAVCKASAGAVEYLSIVRVRNIADFLAQAKEAGAWCYGASADSGVSYLQPDYRGGCVLVIGAEGRGLRPRVAAACDELVALPLRGHVQSLNASAAASALLYGILQRRRAA
jgi:23S rRNA (guanosine2251-2'-O)-methyltransferase